MREWENNIRKVEPYVPGEQPKAVGVVKLNTNENPYPPSPKAELAARDFDFNRLRLYPDPNASQLVHGLAAYYGVLDNQVFVGVGSDDVLSICFLTFFNSDKPILFPDVSYSFYPVWADMYQIPYCEIPVDKDFHIIAEDYYRENGGIIFPNPNAPTSLYMGLDEVENIVKKNQKSVVVVDEAYIDFGGQSALSVLEDKEYFQECVEKIIATRERTKRELETLGFICLDSKTNFIFAQHKKVHADALFEELKRKNIYVRYFNKPKIDNYLRITIGTDEQMNKLFAALKEIINGD